MTHSSGQPFTDQQLVDAVRRGDRTAAARLVGQTENLVASIVSNLIRSPEDRRDIVQDTYGKVFHKLHTFSFQSKLSTWVGQVAYHTAVNSLRKKRLVYPGNLEEIDALHEQALPDVEVIQKELARVLHQHIQALPQVQQLLIGLFHQQELSYAEIGTITGMPEGTIKNYLFRARRELKRRLSITHSKEAL